MFVPIIANDEDYNQYVKCVQDALGDNKDKIIFQQLSTKSLPYLKYIYIINDVKNFTDDDDIIYIMKSEKNISCHNGIFYINFNTGLGCELPIIHLSHESSSLFQINRIVIGLDHPSYDMLILDMVFRCNYAYYKNNLLLSMDKYIFDIRLNPEAYDYFVSWRNAVCNMKITSIYTCSVPKYTAFGMEYLLKQLVDYKNIFDNNTEIGSITFNSMGADNTDIERLSQKQIAEVSTKILLCLNIDRLMKYLQEANKKIKLYGGLAFIYSDFCDSVDLIYNNYEKINKLIKCGSAIKGIELDNELKEFFNIKHYDQDWKLNYKITFGKKKRSRDIEIDAEIHLRTIRKFQASIL